MKHKRKFKIGEKITLSWKENIEEWEILEIYGRNPIEKTYGDYLLKLKNNQKKEKIWSSDTMSDNLLYPLSSFEFETYET